MCFTGYVYRVSIAHVPWSLVTTSFLCFILTLASPSDITSADVPYPRCVVLFAHSPPALWAPTTDLSSELQTSMHKRRLALHGDQSSFLDSSRLAGGKCCRVIRAITSSATIVGCPSVRNIKRVRSGFHLGFFAFAIFLYFRSFRFPRVSM